jgi:predicted ribonuclease toxin of YeeF-YezG toxin-antitoxin module
MCIQTSNQYKIFKEHVTTSKYVYKAPKPKNMKTHEQWQIMVGRNVILEYGLVFYRSIHFLKKSSGETNKDIPVTSTS